MPQAQPAPVARVVVVVPVRDEERRIGACLDAIDHAVRRVHAHPLRHGADSTWPVPDVRVVVVLDACTDRTAAIVATHPGVVTVASGAARVGAARARGVAHALRLDRHPAEQVWIANTDADSRVPPDWLTHQLDCAHDGADVFCGLVNPDIGECGPAVYSAWASAYQHRDGHPHVHGANLGIRASAYARCGGFEPSASAHEDVRLVRAARTRGLSVRSSSLAAVTTSGRVEGRVGAEGFADYLRARTAAPQPDTARPLLAT